MNYLTNAYHAAKYVLFYLKIPGHYNCSNCGAKQFEATSRHIIFCNDCAEMLFDDIRAHHAETIKFLEEHAEEIARHNANEIERLSKR